jgi:hypothetical protein
MQCTIPVGGGEARKREPQEKAKIAELEGVRPPDFGSFMDWMQSR